MTLKRINIAENKITDKASHFGKKAVCMLTLAVMVISFIGNGMVAKAGIKELNKAKYCSFIIPSGFKPTETPGLYVNEHHPLESANISYSVTNIPQDKILTNEEKKRGEKADASDVDILYDELSQEMYQEIQEENYKELYGENINFTIESFENNEIDGFPGYLIKTNFTPEGMQTIHQTVYIILSSNKAFTLVYSWADDDYFEEAFNESMTSIHVR